MIIREGQWGSWGTNYSENAMIQNLLQKSMKSFLKKYLIRGNFIDQKNESNIVRPLSLYDITTSRKNPALIVS